MLIPDKLQLLLERLFSTRVKNGSSELLSLHERIEIYAEAVGYVDRDLTLFSFILGHRRIVTEYQCRRIDELLLNCAYRNPKIIPKDFRDRLPKGTRLAEYLERLYMIDKEYRRFDTVQVYQLAAE